MKNNESSKILTILAIMAGIIFLPLIGLYFKENGVIPADFFQYPPTSAPDKPASLVTLFRGSVVVIMLLIAITFYIKPYWFGFKKVPNAILPKVEKVNFPIWGWVGAFMLGLPLFFLWGHFSEPKILLNWAWVPVFWGYTFLLDGILYVRTGGKSIVNNSPKEMIAIGISAMGGWMIFEYLNFFVDDNWFYPNGAAVPDDEFLLYAIIGSSGLIPVIFVIYRLLNTFPNIKNKYSEGPKLILKNWHINGLMFIFLAGLTAISFLPDVLFGLLWIAPMALLAIGLHKIGLWSPFTDIENGNWSPFFKYSLTYLIYGVSLECINYFSAQHPANEALITHTPAYWVYSIPYVNFWHLFEMPILGFLGYLPFGIYCSVYWISFSYLLNIPSSYLEDEK